jgi:hypothetical protein
MTPQLEAAMLQPSRVSSTTDSRYLEMGLLVQGEVARYIGGFWIYALEIELFIPRA